MADAIIIAAFQYMGYALELGLLIFLFRRGRARGLLSLCLYVLLLLVIDGAARPVVLYTFGFSSKQYFYFYWLTDLALVLAAFLLICSFFKRAFADERLWSYLRLTLAFSFLLILAISCHSLSSHYSDLFSRFTTEFNQNLYFACLVLNTLLYVMMQRAGDSADEELSMLVCGLGIEFAGPAANLAFMYLTPGLKSGGSVLAYLVPACNLAMLSIWFYAVSRDRKPARVYHRRHDARLAVPA